jgi:hypothetical protein
MCFGKLPIISKIGAEAMNTHRRQSFSESVGSGGKPQARVLKSRLGIVITA